MTSRAIFKLLEDIFSQNYSQPLSKLSSENMRVLCSLVFSVENLTSPELLGLNMSLKSLKISREVVKPPRQVRKLLVKCLELKRTVL